MDSGRCSLGIDEFGGGTPPPRGRNDRRRDATAPKDALPIVACIPYTGGHQELRI